MSTKIYYPRSSARPIYLVAAVLGLLGLVGIIMMLVAMADVPRQSYYLLIAAFGLLVVALSGALAVLLATNTRRPWGIDPNYGPPPAPSLSEPIDPYGVTTEELMHAVQLPDGKGYGRRQNDDRTVVKRLAAKSEHDEWPGLPAPSRPSWADEMLPPQYREERQAPAPVAPPASPAVPPEEPPAPPHFDEVPLDQLDQLDLLPATPSNTAHEPDRSNGGA